MWLLIFQLLYIYIIHLAVPCWLRLENKPHGPRHLGSIAFRLPVLFRLWKLLTGVQRMGRAAISSLFSLFLHKLSGSSYFPTRSIALHIYFLVRSYDTVFFSLHYRLGVRIASHGCFSLDIS